MRRNLAGEWVPDLKADAEDDQLWEDAKKTPAQVREELSEDDDDEGDEGDEVRTRYREMTTELINGYSDRTAFEKLTTLYGFRLTVDSLAGVSAKAAELSKRYPKKGGA